MYAELRQKLDDLGYQLLHVGGCMQILDTINAHGALVVSTSDLLYLANTPELSHALGYLRNKRAKKLAA